jgi:adenylyltransferase/sulfurtransferase
MKNQEPHIKNRYQRQEILKGFGVAAQEKLATAKVLVVGAGGLGCPALLYLAAAGTGTIGIADFDQVQASNLHRQVLFTEEDLGSLKVTAAVSQLQKRNSEIELIAYPIRLDASNCISVLETYDIILDGSDNFSTRYMLNDACVLLNKPLIMGAISQFEGQVAVFNAAGKDSVQYRDLFPTPPAANDVLNCAEAGVLGVLPGLIGIQMATETIKLITGIGNALIDQLFTYNALTNEASVFGLSKHPMGSKDLPATRDEFQQTDYAWLCGEDAKGIEIKEDQFIQLRQGKLVQVIDVREYHETPVVTATDISQIPLSELAGRLNEINGSTVLLFCQSGVRSRKAATLLTEHFGKSRTVYSLAGGLQQAVTLTTSAYEREKN